ncbi:DUF1080 domain-containing protein [Temperatibacter marinus]|uniref:DUF1080 domain-containing protein n=1 Tax=Temperatibacter marinus TaxID=1456591 RepID=A0AA52EFY1_9PROT|nr:DUF1080 domain-containing protein [Temperatibacter marinus]WND01804.1 DUF1080 domain-containing protein [Temperatibacter marinus]
MIKRLKKVGCIMGFCLAVACAEVSLSEKEKGSEDKASKDKGWIILFDGSSTEQWRTYLSDDLNKEWQIIDGALTLTKKGGGDIISKGTYGDFILELEWKISAGGNSGIFYHVIEDAKYSKVYLTGPEYQLLDNKGRSEPPLEQAGSLFALYAPTTDVTKPVGNYNKSRLVVRGAKVEHYLNGSLVTAYDRESSDYQQRVAASKFGKWPGFDSTKTGHIALQDHGDVVAFKNIRIKDLSN